MNRSGLFHHRMEIDLHGHRLVARGDKRRRTRNQPRQEAHVHDQGEGDPQGCTGPLAAHAAHPSPGPVGLFCRPPVGRDERTASACYSLGA